MDGAIKQRRSFDATLRPRRQITLPAEVCEALAIELGDQLEIEIMGDTVLLRRKRGGALDALKEIQRAFAGLSASEGSIESERRRVRELASQARYGAS